jgi:uncharacterized SAM-binding protein YcdF (DUF218 family)
LSRWGCALTSLLAAAIITVVAMIVYVVPRDDVPVEADVVVVLGGAGGERAELGIELADRFEVPLVLSSSASIFGERQGRTCGEDAICFEPVPENTAGEAENMARMAEAEGWEHVIVATSSFHTSRSRFLFEQCLGDERISVLGRTAEGRTATNPRLVLRESLGIVAGATFARAC